MGTPASIQGFGFGENTHNEESNGEEHGTLNGNWGEKYRGCRPLYPTLAF